MSLFLGPIHYIVFDKIHLNEEITKTIVETSEQSCDLNRFAPAIEEGDLKELIGDSMIHPWLAERVTRSELRQIGAIEDCLSPELDQKITDAIYNIGKRVGNTLEKEQTLTEAFNRVRFHTLDGMPCDNGLIFLENTETSIIWELNLDLHRPYMKNDKTEILFLDIRYAFVKGLLENSIYKLERLDRNRYRLYND